LNVTPGTFKKKLKMFHYTKSYSYAEIIKQYFCQWEILKWDYIEQLRKLQETVDLQATNKQRTAHIE